MSGGEECCWILRVSSEGAGPRVPCRNLGGGGGAKHGKSRECKKRMEVVEDRETIDLSAMAK